MEQAAADACSQASGTSGIALVAIVGIASQLFGFSLDPTITFCPRSNQTTVLECLHSGR